MFNNIKKCFELQLHQYFNKQNVFSSTLKSAMTYSLLNSNSKRIRAILVYLISECFDLSSKNIFNIAFAVESIHTYSLIHDDLPCMDNDAIRRGIPSCHIKYGEATALLAGNALQSMAFSALSEIEFINIKQLKDIITTFSRYTGVEGILSGQQYDIALSNINNIKSYSNISKLKKLYKTYNLKTGALFSSCIMIPFFTSKYYKNNF